MHDLGLIAVTRTEDGVARHGFETYVGGGLGAVPHQARLFDEFLPVEELLPSRRPSRACSPGSARSGTGPGRASSSS